MAIGDKIPVEAIKKTLAENPVLKWAVIGFVAIFAVEFAAKEGISIWKEVATARLEVEAKNLENWWAVDRRAGHAQTPAAEREAELRAVNELLAKRAAGETPQSAAGPQGETKEFQDKRQSLAMLLSGLSGAASLVILWRSSRAGAGLSRKTFARRSLRTAPLALAVAYGGPWLAHPLAEVVGLQIQWVWMGLVFMGLFMSGLLLPVAEVFWAVWQLLRKEDGPSFNTD